MGRDAEDCCGDSRSNFSEDFITPCRLHEHSLTGGHTNFISLSPSLSNLLFISFQTRSSVSITWAIHTETTRLSWYSPVTVVVCHSAWLPICLHILCKGLETHWEAYYRLTKLFLFLLVAWYHFTFFIILRNWPCYFFSLHLFEIGFCSSLLEDRIIVWMRHLESWFWGWGMRFFALSDVRTEHVFWRLDADLNRLEKAWICFLDMSNSSQQLLVLVASV